jgi:hypothetical protein
MLAFVGVRDPIALLGVAAATVWLTACGSNAPMSGGSAGAPSPTPGTTPGPSAFAYVLNAEESVLMAFEASAATGQLRLIERHDVPEPRLLAGDPRGRSLQVAGGGTSWSGDPATPPYVRSYAVDPGSGHLAGRSENDENPFGCPWTALAATERQAYLMAATCVTGYHGGWLVLDVDPATGALTPAATPPVRWEPAFVVADPEDPFVYSVAVERYACDWCHMLYMSATHGDGRIEDLSGVTLNPGKAFGATLGERILYLVHTGSRILSFAVGDRNRRPALVARLDSAFAGDFSHLAFGRSTVPRLEPAASNSPRTWLALSTRTRLYLYAAPDSGELSVSDEATLPAPATWRLAFHPSGRFLYASSEGEGTRVFAIDDGRLREVGQDPLGGRWIVVLAP